VNQPAVPLRHSVPFQVQDCSTCPLTTCQVSGRGWAATMGGWWAELGISLTHALPWPYLPLMWKDRGLSALWLQLTYPGSAGLGRCQ
jgi:hypothetical protein